MQSFLQSGGTELCCQSSRLCRPHDKVRGDVLDQRLDRGLFTSSVAKWPFYQKRSLSPGVDRKEWTLCRLVHSASQRLQSSRMPCCQGRCRESQHIQTIIADLGFSLKSSFHANRNSSLALPSIREAARLTHRYRCPLHRTKRSALSTS